MATRLGSIVIEAIEPRVDDGRYAVKRIIGDVLTVRADIFKEGHTELAAIVKWRLPALKQAHAPWNEVPMKPLGNDAWEASFRLDALGRHVFTIEAWPDHYRTWAHELERKLSAGRDVSSELLEGALLLHQAAQRAEPLDRSDAQRLKEVAQLLERAPPQDAAAHALSPELIELASRHPDRAQASHADREYPVYVDRARAQFAAWYEFFPRSASHDRSRHGTFRDAQAELTRIAAMGFDTVYLPPIHPIGRTGRKGKNNSLKAQPDDVGSPWAIGSSEGGHKAIHPSLGTLDDFKAFLTHARTLGLEVALDLAFQCSPDHPYLREHLEWFSKRPDGTIKTAENPPKRYEDIVNFDFLGEARESLWRELRSVVKFWIDVGVTTFRVDNPHTKPIPFWAWLIESIQSEHPEVIFLSEAFTRPKVMKALAKAGFTQSYTYFTWRNFKEELEAYLTELTQGPSAEYMRGNLWPNTPDILPEILQRGGPAAFKSRLVLAATLSSLYGIYSGYELCENQAVPGTEEYLDSEKYELKPRDWSSPGNLTSFITRVNQIRRAEPALALMRNLHFCRCDNPHVLAYAKMTPDGTNALLIAVNLDPHGEHEAILHVPLEHFGLAADEPYQAFEQMAPRAELWRGPLARVRLTPDMPAAIFRIERFRRQEGGFEYY